MPTETAIPTATLTPLPTSTPTVPPTETPTVVAIATGESGSTVTTTLLENGWTQYEVLGEGFSIALPPGWTHIELNPESFSKMLSVIGDLNPALGNMFSSEAVANLAASGIKFYAMDLSSVALKSGFPPSINVMMLDVGMAIPLEAFAATNLQQVKGLASPDFEVTNERVQLGDLEAEKITYETDLNAATGTPLRIRFNQYLAVQGTTIYVITLASAGKAVDQYEQDFEEIANSFAIGK